MSLMASHLVQEEAGGGLLVKLDKRKAGVPQTAAAVAARWFAQDMFADPSLAEEAPEELHASAAAAGTASDPPNYPKNMPGEETLCLCPQSLCDVHDEHKYPHMPFVCLLPAEQHVSGK